MITRADIRVRKFEFRGIERWVQAAKAGGLACLSGLFLLLAFPSIEYDWFGWVFLVPLLLALDGKSPAGSFAVSFVAGLVFFGGIFGPVAAGTVDSLKPIHFIVSSLYFSGYWGLWGAGFVWMRQMTPFSSPLIAAALWVTLEYARAHAGFLSYPGLLLGHTTYRHHSLIQLASLTGVYGLSFVLVFMNAGLAESLHLIRQRAWSKAVRSLLPPLCLVATSVMIGHSILLSEQPAPQFPVALVQGNILPHDKWVPFGQERILAEYARLTEQAAAESPKLIVWPESAIPGDVLHQIRLQQQISQMAVASRAFLLVGNSEYAKFSSEDMSNRDYYNSMVLVSPSGNIIGTYRKQKLVPFAEYVPLDQWVSWPRFIGSVLGGTVAGHEWPIFDVEEVQVATVICWETLFPDLFREFVLRGADLMIAATDESWFGNTSEPYQLLAITVFRAVENRIAIVRAANTGLSAFIDPFGRITAKVSGGKKDLFVQDVLSGAVPLSREHTFYTRFGEAFATFAIALTVFCVLYASAPQMCCSLVLLLLPHSCMRQKEGERI